MKISAALREHLQSAMSTEEVESALDFIDDLVYNFADDITTAQRAEASARKHAERSLNALTQMYERMRDLSEMQPMLQDLVGTGFSSDRSLRRHVGHWTDQIQAAYPGDLVKQSQVPDCLFMVAFVRSFVHS